MSYTSYKMFRENKPGLSSGDNEERETPRSVTPLVEEKIMSAWGSARDQFGVANYQRMAELFYQSLYAPDSINSAEIVEMPGFDRKSVLLSHLPKNTLPVEIPSKQEFTDRIIRATVKEINLEQSLHDGARELVATFADHGPIVIWTAGDVQGLPEEGYPGSNVQHHRIVLGGFNDLRHEIAESKNKDHKDVLSVVAGENKKSLLPHIFERFHKLGVGKIVIVEDHAHYLDSAKTEAEKEGFEVYPIWVTHGEARDRLPQTANKSTEEWRGELNAVDSLQDILPRLEADKVLDDPHVGFLLDYDDVLSNEKKRQKAHSEAAVLALKENGWLNF